jgi:hypothetical protein
MSQKIIIVNPNGSSYQLQINPDGSLAATSAKAYPGSQGNIFDTAVAANTNFLSTAITPNNTPCTLRVYVCLSASGVFSVQRTKASTTVAEMLNGGVPLVANDSYTFDVPVDASETINFQTSIAATILKLNVVEKDLI